VDFKNTVVIMTSNLGAERIQAHARRNEEFEELKDDLMQLLRSHFRPEFLNRIDEIIIFRALTKDQVIQITELLLDRVRRRLRAQRIELSFTPEAEAFIADRGYDPEFGARPLQKDDPAARGEPAVPDAAGWRDRRGRRRDGRRGRRRARLRRAEADRVGREGEEDEGLGAGGSLIDVVGVPRPSRGASSRSY
jgi:hypothetical protein